MTNVLWAILSYTDGFYDGQDSLAKLARVKKSALDKNLRKLTALGLIAREQNFARKGVQQRYWVNMDRLNALASNNQRVDIDTPNKTNRVELETAKGVTESLNECNEIHPYRKKDTQISSNEDLESYLKFIPSHKQFKLNRQLKEVLEELRHKGTTFKAIEDLFYTTNWDAINMPSVFVLKSLTDLNARPVKYSQEFPPPHCGECDPVERKFPYLVENSSGQASQYCFTCNWYWVNKRNGY